MVKLLATSILFLLTAEVEVAVERDTLAARGERPKQLSVTLENIERLELRFGLVDLVKHLEEMVQLDRGLQTELVRGLVRAYFAYEGAREEARLLQEQAANLEAIWRLQARLAEAAQVPRLPEAVWINPPRKETEKNGASSLNSGVELSQSP